VSCLEDYSSVIPYSEPMIRSRSESAPRLHPAGTDVEQVLIGEREIFQLFRRQILRHVLDTDLKNWSSFS
jgi:hypothetical protein